MNGVVMLYHLYVFLTKKRANAVFENFLTSCAYLQYLQLIIVRVPRNYEDNIPVDYESELRVSNLSLKVVTNEKGEASGAVLTITITITMGEVVLGPFLSFYWAAILYE